jgi:hypothetical protein
MGTAQEDLHTITTKNYPTMIMKLNLSKAYDETSRLYLKLMLLVGFSLPVVNWIVGCITCLSFVVLVMAHPQFRLDHPKD